MLYKGLIHPQGHVMCSFKYGPFGTRSFCEGYCLHTKKPWRINTHVVTSRWVQGLRQAHGTEIAPHLGLYDELCKMHTLDRLWDFRVWRAYHRTTDHYNSVKLRILFMRFDLWFSALQ